MIANRRFLFENLKKSFRLAKREQHSIAFLMVDIDDFKYYNDLFGHLHGDSVLKRVAKAVATASKRPLDFTGRYGGEEFLVVLPNSDFDGACIVSQRILKAVQDLRIKHYKKADKFLSVSVGFSVIRPTQDDTIDDVIAVADEYLYKVKGTGKNHYMGTTMTKGEKE
jgi:diguanylate cyclase (GGDEF)-like protein